MSPIVLFVHPLPGFGWRRADILTVLVLPTGRGQSFLNHGRRPWTTAGHLYLQGDFLPFRESCGAARRILHKCAGRKRAELGSCGRLGAKKASSRCTTITATPEEAKQKARISFVLRLRSPLCSLSVLSQTLTYCTPSEHCKEA